MLTLLPNIFKTEGLNSNVCVRGSSNGRTVGFEPTYRGSSPRPRAKKVNYGAQVFGEVISKNRIDHSTFERK